MKSIRTFLCISFALCISQLAQADAEDVKPQGKYVLMGDYRLYFHCLGEGKETVLIDAGIGDSSANWLGIANEVAQDTRVCLFDRAGYGMSDAGPSPRSTSTIVEELYNVLLKAEIPGPYILVGHSFGGFTAQYFARVLPQETAGVVLVESSHPDQPERLSELDTMRDAKPKQLIKVLEQDQNELSAEQIYWNFLNGTRKAIYAQMEELRAFKQSAKEVKAQKEFPDVPLVVLSRGRSQLPAVEGKHSLETVWQAMQSELVAMSEQGQQVIVKDSGHSIHLDSPDAVVDGIRQILKLSESKSRQQG